MAAGMAWPKDAIHTNSLALSEQLVLEGQRILLMTWLQGTTPRRSRPEAYRAPGRRRAAHRHSPSQGD
jgi:hypothetical protein